MSVIFSSLVYGLFFYYRTGWVGPMRLLQSLMALGEAKINASKGPLSNHVLLQVGIVFLSFFSLYLVM